MTTSFSTSNTPLETALAQVITALAADNDDAQEAVNLFATNPLMQDALACLSNGDLDGFYIRVQYPNDKLYRALVRHFVGDIHQIQFLVAEHDLVESHFRHWIEAIEGFGCTADKTRTLIRALFHFFKTGKEIRWNYSQEYTYHLPKKVFVTHEEIIGFFDSIRRLRVGNPDLYLKELIWLMERRSQVLGAPSSAA